MVEPLGECRNYELKGSRGQSPLHRIQKVVVQTAFCPAREAHKKPAQAGNFIIMCSHAYFDKLPTTLKLRRTSSMSEFRFSLSIIFLSGKNRRAADFERQHNALSVLIFLLFPPRDQSFNRHERTVHAKLIGTPVHRDHFLGAEF